MVSARYLLDSSYVSAAYRDPSIGQRLVAVGADCAIASAVWHELSFGVARLPAGRKKRLLAEYMRTVVARLPILPYDHVAAEWHATERARLESTGRPRPYADGIIAATAAAHARTILTRNPADFVGYRGLSVREDPG